MTATAELRAPDTRADEGGVTHPFDSEDHRTALLASLRVALARAKLVAVTIEEIGLDLKAGRLTPRQAMRECLRQRIDSLFPRESDGC